MAAAKSVGGGADRECRRNQPRMSGLVPIATRRPIHAGHPQRHAVDRIVAGGLRAALPISVRRSGFRAADKELQAITDAAWDAYADSRKAPRTRKAGAGFADPDYDLSVDWLAARDAIADAQRATTTERAVAHAAGLRLVAHRSHLSRRDVEELAPRRARQRDDRRPAGIEIDVLDLSRTTSEYGRTIHPCKSCVSTAMPLCHWPCSCYPNYALGQAHDWMNEIYPLWVAAHGIMIVTPVNWYQAPGPLKAMMDRLVCADGGNPDPTSTHGKDAERRRRSSSMAGLIRATSPAASSRSSCMATRPAPKRCGAV